MKTEQEIEGLREELRRMLWQKDHLHNSEYALILVENIKLLRWVLEKK